MSTHVRSSIALTSLAELFKNYKTRINYKTTQIKHFNEFTATDQQGHDEYGLRMKYPN